ncbi:MAG: PIN domain nuclease [Candidatus Riflebacteria bacterium HGW-Riflebacteria-1]|nr:MAG: PIN domain nuclease [Candidatus Riflebacteria bacterium HGW-Riflebacteria-1]
MELNYLLDTNIILYHLGGKLKRPLPNGRFIVSFVTEIELLSYPSLELAEEKVIRNFLKRIQVIGIDQEITEKTILLRRKFKLKTPDAIVAATASVYDSCILTNDAHFQRIDELRCKNLAVK